MSERKYLEREPTMGMWEDFCAVFPVPFEQFRKAWSAARDAAPSMGDMRMGHDEAQKRIAECVREIEILCDAFGYDPTQWLYPDDDDGPSDSSAPPPAGEGNSATAAPCTWPNCACEAEEVCRRNPAIAPANPVAPEAAAERAVKRWAIDRDQQSGVRLAKSGEIGAVYIWYQDYDALARACEEMKGENERLKKSATASIQYVEHAKERETKITFLEAQLNTVFMNSRLPSEILSRKLLAAESTVARLIEENARLSADNARLGKEREELAPDVLSMCSRLQAIAEIVGALEALHEKATPGPWAVFGEGSVRKPGGVFAEEPGTQGKFVCKPDEWEDAELIAAYHNALPELIRRVKGE